MVFVDRRLQIRRFWRYLPLVLIVIVGILLSACGGSGASAPDSGAYRHEMPSEYYLYLPEDYSPDRRWPVFVGVHGSGGSGRDCWNDWQPYAEHMLEVMAAGPEKMSSSRQASISRP